MRLDMGLLPTPLMGLDMGLTPINGLDMGLTPPWTPPKPHKAA